VTGLAPTLEAFFTERLIGQQHASPHTVVAYRDTFCLLLVFLERRTGTRPSSLRLEDLHAGAISAFLDHLETERANHARTRNARLAAIHSLFRFASLRHPEHAALIERVLAIPTKRFERGLVSFLSDDEVEALLAAPDATTRIGRRDRALLQLAVQTGLRVSELVGLDCGDVVTKRAAPHVRCIGKGRKERVTPLTAATANVVGAWIAECGGRACDPLFPSSHGGGRLTRYAVTVLLTKHVVTATERCPSLGSKTVSPHVLRHTCAMRLLHAGVDSTVIALWLGHEAVATTQVYVHADLALKERALARTTPIGVAPGRFKPADTLIDFLEAL
jgi:site-specific recombinase XerD